MRRASSTALMITDRPVFLRIRLAALRAASVAPDTAMPTSACFSAGASFTPSPVMATMCPASCSALTMANLCSGKTSANPSVASTAASSFRLSAAAPSPATAMSFPATSIFVPRPNCPAISRAIATLSPVTILTSIP